MDEKDNCSSSTWFGNMFQKFEAVYQEVEDLVNKDTVQYFEKQMETVGKCVKEFYSSAVKEIHPPVGDPLPLNQVDSVLDIQENLVDSNTNTSDADVDIIQQEDDTNSDTHNQENLPVEPCPRKDENFTEDPTAKIACESSETHLDKRSESGSTVYEDADCRIETSINMKIEDLNVSPLEGKALVDDLSINCSQEEKSIEEFELENSSEDKEESPIHLLPETLYDFDEEDDQCPKLTEFEASESCLKTGGEGSVTVDLKELNMDTIDLSDKKTLVESCVIVENEELNACSNKARRSKSYKKIIRDAFMSKRRVAKEYKQLAIWQGDINEIFVETTETTPKSTAQDSHDSEWEIV